MAVCRLSPSMGEVNQSTTPVATSVATPVARFASARLNADRIMDEIKAMSIVAVHCGAPLARLTRGTRFSLTTNRFAQGRLLEVWFLSLSSQTVRAVLPPTLWAAAKQPRPPAIERWL